MKISDQWVDWAVMIVCAACLAAGLVLAVAHTMG